MLSNRSREILLSLIAGLLAAAAFEPIAWWPLIFISIALFARILMTTTSPLLCGLSYGLAFFIPLLKWSGTYVGWLPWIALSTLQALFFIPFAWIASRLRSPWLFAAAWVAMEAARSRIPWGGFGWGRVAFSQPDSPLLPLASVGGSVLLSLAVVALSAALMMRRISPVILLALIPFAVVALPSSSGESLKVAAIQGNVPRLGLDFNSQREAVLSNHLNATATLASGSVDLAIWPENASDVDPFTVRDRIQSVVDQLQAPVLVGGVPRQEGRLFNASILWNPRSGPASIYLKQDLAPFGEYMPLRTIAEALVPAAKRVENFSAGNGTVVHQVAKSKVGSVICFEVLDDGLMRQVVDAGAQLIAVQTNSATFGRSAQSEQQLAISRIRAMESARSIISVSTSGVSALITERGKILAKSKIFEEKVLVGSLKLTSAKTISGQIGGWSEVTLIALPWIGAWLRRWNLRR